MANGIIQYVKDIINDSIKSSKTTYSSKKIEELLEKINAGNADMVSLTGCYDTAPTSCVKDDVYYNTTSKLVFKATAANTWEAIGKAPEVDTIYADMNDNKIYVYDGTNFDSFGGGNTKVSQKANNAIEEITGSTNKDEDGIYVEDISDEIRKMLLKNRMEDDDAYFFATNTNLVPANNYKAWDRDTSLVNCLVDKREGKLKVSSDGYITLTEGIWNLTAGTINGGTSAITILWKDRAGNILSNNGYVREGDSNDADVDSNAIVKVEKGQTLEVAPIRTTGDTNIETCFSFVKVFRVGIITIDPMEYVNASNGVEDTPVGHVMSVMAINPPKHYLVADGSILNINDYSYLAKHFEKEFGASNYFGGDGTTTFALPDLQGEFLRGTGTNGHANQGSGSGVGEHQDATYRFEGGENITLNSTIFGIYLDKTNGIGGNYDSYIKGSGRYANYSAADTGNYTSTYGTYRPTNTSVLYVIKYEPTYYVKSINGYEQVEELLQNKADFTAPSVNNTISPNKAVTLSNSIENFDEIEITLSIVDKASGVEREYYDETKRIRVSDIEYCAAFGTTQGGFFQIDNKVVAPDGFHVMSTVCSFKDSNTFMVFRLGYYQSKGTASWTKIRLKSIKGIRNKYTLGTGSGNSDCDCGTLSTSDINTAITNSETELDK